jgi:predicted AAA+ superfamily ATPase
MRFPVAAEESGRSNFTHERCRISLTFSMAASLAERYLHDAIATDLAEKMVFLSGPRQVGKTTLALRVIGAADHRHPAYLSWDDVRARPRIRSGELPPGERRIVLDEIHKYARWRNLVKGLYDTREPGQSFLVTGSARLEIYRRGGDSLHGRYHSYRLHPVSLREAGGGRDALDALLRFGGFPEPFCHGSERHWRRWQRERLDRVVRDDLRDLERVREVSLVELLVDALPARVGSPLSVKSLREDLEVAHDTAERWLTILENLYVCFRIAPFGAPRIRAVKEERKLYLWDWSMVEQPGPKFENLIASHLLKLCHFLEDTEGYRIELRFLRDTDGREVDFVVLRDRKPWFAVEAKTGEQSVSQAVRYFKERTAVPTWYQVHLGTKDAVVDGVRLLPFAKLCEELQIP